MRRLAPLLVIWLLLVLGCVNWPKSYWVPNHVLLPNVDYSAWDALLRAHVHDGRVDYHAFAASQEFREFLLVIRRTRLTQDSTREQRLAFYINAYNARAIQGVLDGGSPASLWGRFQFFKRERHAVGGEDITLWDLEHKRIRSMGEARIHFALVCASASCPKLASRAYLPETVDSQLQEAALAFVNDPTRNRFDPERRVAHLSPIFEWYEADFVGASGSIHAYVALFVENPRVAEELAAGRYKIRFLDYDWSLNGAPPPER